MQKYFLTEKQLTEKIADMSLKDKLLELTQYNSYLLARKGKEKTVTGTSVLHGLDTEELWGMGSTLNTRDAEEIIALRKEREKRGIKEPVAVMHDVIHGYRTIYPVPLALACSFDLPLIEDCAVMAATEARYDGIDVTFSPMVDLVRDARWGRVMESAGEDPYYAGEVGKAFIRGYHSGGIAACVKHFAGYGAAEAGKEYNTTDISEHTLREYYLRAYRACLDENPEMFMSSFNVLNGVPVLGNRQLMVDTLRGEWGFDGVLVSDYAIVYDMIAQGYCADADECAEVALDAGLDIEMCSPTYLQSVPKLLENGKVTMEQVDAAVLRVLKLKNKLGLYGNPDRYINLTKRDEVQLSPAHRALALKAAEESCVLLKNDGVLPLKTDSVTLIGPFACEKAVFGNWCARGKAEETVSLQEGVEQLLGHKVIVAEGCSGELSASDTSSVSAAVEAAKGAEIIVACVGEPMKNSGEGHSRTRLELPSVQKELLRALKALGKPLVVVVFGGRPQAITEEVELADALLYAWQPGSESGNALANLLFGKAVPCGKTVMSFPRTTGQCPVYYNYLETCRPKKSADVPGMGCITGYDDEMNAPLFPFGYGLSYTRFEYSDFRLSADVIARGGSLTASVRVANTGKYDGAEVVQWYIRDKFASVVRPVKELKGFERVFLKAGEARTVRFTVTEEMLKFYTASGEFKAETGGFTLFAGGNCRDTLCADFTLKDESDFDLPRYDNQKYLRYYWDGDIVYNESAMLVKNKDGTLDPVKLLYDIERIVSVRSADLTERYTENVDYKVEDGKLIILPDGSIPVMEYGDMYFDAKPEVGEIGVSDGNGYFPTVDGKYEKYEEAGVLYRHQIAVTYTHKHEKKYTVPPTQSQKFKLFLGKLAKGERVNIAVLGDSISDGCSASGFWKLEPYTPDYFGMLGDYIRTKYAHADVQAVNYSVGGMNSCWGVTQTDKVAALRPDLVILGFGMNDGSSYIDEKDYYANMLQTVDGIRKANPDCAFVVLGTMLPNEKICRKEGGPSIRGNQEKYLTALRRLSKERTGVAVADITTLHKEYLRVKKYRDMTGNNVNHPNDFLVRLYAQTIIKTIFG